MKNLKDKKVTVIGLGRTGLATTRFLTQQKANVFVSEEKSAGEIDQNVIKEVQNLGAQVEIGGHTSKAIKESELIIVSPGVHLDIPILEQAKEKGISIISEIELAYPFLTCPLIAITGTNGKTTTTVLIGEMLKNGGKRVAVAGNIGHPLIAVEEKDLDYAIVEVSSYQLETIKDFKPQISILLNITEDHLARHKTMEEYIKAKGNIFANQEKDEFMIYNIDDGRVAKLINSARAKTIPFSREKILLQGVFIEEGKIIARLGEKDIVICKTEEIKIKGEHNLENSLAAITAGLLCGLKSKAIAEALRKFPGVEHRIEDVATIGEVDFINDSKGTNPEATVVALNTVADNRNIILIAGGKDKGTDLNSLIEKIKAKTKHVILIGEATARFKENLEKGGFQAIDCADSLEGAVEMSFKLAKKGDKVLLSPACASFDMFTDFEQRGRIFKKEVRKLLDLSTKKCYPKPKLS